MSKLIEALRSYEQAEGPQTNKRGDPRAAPVVRCIGFTPCAIERCGYSLRE